MSEQQSLTFEILPPEKPPAAARRVRPPARQTTGEAIRSADEAANEEWKAVADQCAQQVASRSRTVLAEQVRHEVEKHPYAQTHQLRAMGAVMTRAATNGHIAETGIFIRSTDNTQHSTPHMLWRSLICAVPHEVSLPHLVRISDEAYALLKLIGFEMETIRVL